MNRLLTHRYPLYGYSIYDQLEVDAAVTYVNRKKQIIKDKLQMIHSTSDTKLYHQTFNTLQTGNNSFSKIEHLFNLKKN